MKRRTFLQSSVAAAAAMGLSNDLFAAGAITKPGVQLWSLPQLLEKDFNGTIASLAKMGYKELELYGPYPFSTDVAKKNWEGIARQVGFSVSGFYDKSTTEFSRILKANGMTVPSIHCDLDTMTNNMAGIAEAANTVGFTYITLPAIPEDKRKTLDDYKRLADDFNKIGENAKKHNLKFTYHNHGYGIVPVNGVVPLYTLLDATDPKLVFLELDIYWTVAGGADPVALLKKYPNRYHLMHVKDMKEKKVFTGDGGSPQQWMELFPYMTTVGAGVMDIKSIVTAAKKAGTTHFIVEQDGVADPMVALKTSVDYLKAV